MTRGEAVTRINEALGFRLSGNALEGTIIKRLQEAQRDLESGKTLPRFLLLEDQTLSLVQGAHTVSYPTNFLRPDDDCPIHFTDQDSNLPRFLRSMRYRDAVETVMGVQRPDQPTQMMMSPTVYTFRQGNIDFISFADRNYTLTWNYYKAGAVLTTDIENEWLANAPEWLIGEAGGRVALDTRDPEGKALFDEMTTKARAAVFGDILADEDAEYGPIVMGGWL